MMKIEIEAASPRELQAKMLDMLIGSKTLDELLRRTERGVLEKQRWSEIDAGWDKRPMRDVVETLQAKARELEMAPDARGGEGSAYDSAASLIASLIERPLP